MEREAGIQTELTKLSRTTFPKITLLGHIRRLEPVLHSLKAIFLTDNERSFSEKLQPRCRFRGCTGMVGGILKDCQTNGWYYHRHVSVQFSLFYTVKPTSQFQVDWGAQTVTCPRGQRSVYWKLATKPSPLEKIHVQFDRRDCAACPVRALCTKSPEAPRKLVLQPKAQQEALRQARDFIGSEAWSALYRERAGIEGTLSQGIRSSGLRRTRYRGLARTSLQSTAIGAAINVSRVVNWLDSKPRAATRQPRFTRLAA